MKTLTKIKMINWHGFFNETIDISGKTLVTGENGCGKSTLIDAIYYVLSGGETDKFNSAANDRASRTIETYMRGKTGIEGKEFLRNDSDIISHIALEFFDDIDKYYFIIGVVLEIQNNKNKIGKSFYHIKRTKINDSLFTQNVNGEQNIINFKLMKKRIGENNINSLDETSTKSENIRKNIYSILQLDGKKYYELLPKAIAFKPIPDVNDFVFKFLMPQQDVDLDAIRTDINTYNEVQEKINLDKEKEKKLKEIIEKGKTYRKYLLDSKLFKAYKYQKIIDNAKKEIEICNNKIKAIDSTIADIDSSYKEYEKQKESIQQSIYEIEHNNSYQALAKIEKDIEFERINNQKLNDCVNQLNRNILDESKIAKELNINTCLQTFIKTEDYCSFKEELEKYKQKLNETADTINEKIMFVKEKLTEGENKKKDLNDKISKIKNGLPSYRDNVLSLQQVIQEGIFNMTGENIKVIPFCELLDIVSGEERWRNALEGYLHTRRFDLFVPEKYYDMALNLYEKYKSERKIYGVGLVNTKKLTGKEEICPNSLATKLVAFDERAKSYANYILGNVICVETEGDLKKYDSSITPTVMVYQNKAARQTKPQIYQTPFIGRDALKIQLEQLQLYLQDCEKECNDLDAQKTSLEIKRRKINNSRYSKLEDVDNYWNKAKISKQKLNDMSEQFDKLKEQSGTLFVDLNGFYCQRDVIISKTKELHNKEIQYNSEKNGKQNLINVDNEKINKNKPILEDCLRDNDVRAVFYDFVKENNLSFDEIDNKERNAIGQIGKYESDTTKLMKDYINKYGFDSNSLIDSLDDFFKEYHLVVERELAKYEERLEKVKQTALITFQNSYIAEIRKHILDEQEHIKKLNKVLEDKPFGTDKEKYQFKATKSKDPAFGEFYDIFISNEDFIQSDLFTDQLSDKNLALVQDLFKRLTTDTNDEKSEKLVREYTDYRRFMSYDIEITNKNGDVSKFSKINKEKSGGETQTPFYVIIAASFDQIIHGGFGKKSTGCIVMLDEAFNNMDESHIDSMMKYFSQLDIQPVIAVPTQRAKTIMPYVDTTIALVKKNNRIIPRPMIRK